MYSLKKFTSMLTERLERFTHVEQTEFEITPYRDWPVLVVVMVIIGSVFIGMAVYLFFLINSNEITVIKDAEVGLSGSVNEGKLDTVLQIFKARDEEFERLLQVPPRVIDPSL